MRSNYKKLGPYIREIDVRNSDLRTTYLRGISSIFKEFVKSKANTVGVSFHNYKIVEPRQFAFNPNTARMGDKIPIALNTGEQCIVSSIYPVFEVLDPEELLPEYLMMWFRRPEFDRYARFMSHGSAREIFGWQEMCGVELPVPSIEKQREIVKEYQTVVDRIHLNEQLNQKLEETAQAIYRHWFVDFEFPMSAEYARSIGKPELEGQPYKSSGGEMEFNEVLEQEIPKDWREHRLDSLGSVKGGKRLPSGEELIKDRTNYPYIKVADLGGNKFVTLTNSFEYLKPETQERISRYIVDTGDLIISIVGTIGIVKLIDETLEQANLTENCAKITDRVPNTGDYLYHFLTSEAGKREIEMRTVGGVQGKLPLYNISSINVIIPEQKLLALFSETLKPLNMRGRSSIVENDILNRLVATLLSSIAKAV